jgi:hypothetical protein
MDPDLPNSGQARRKSSREYCHSRRKYILRDRSHHSFLIVVRSIDSAGHISSSIATIADLAMAAVARSTGMIQRPGGHFIIVNSV